MALIGTGRTQGVHTTKNTLFSTLWHIGVDIVLIHHRNIVEDILLLLVHTAHAILNNHCQFVTVGGVIGNTVGDGASKDMAMPILMLQPLSIECSSPSSTANHKATRLHITCSPRQITNALKAKHRVVDIERHHVDAMVGVGGGRSHPLRHRTRLVDPLL